MQRSLDEIAARLHAQAGSLADRVLAARPLRADLLRQPAAPDKAQGQRIITAAWRHRIDSGMRRAGHCRSLACSVQRAAGASQAPAKRPVIACQDNGATGRMTP